MSGSRAYTAYLGFSIPNPCLTLSTAAGGPMSTGLATMMKARHHHVGKLLYRHVEKLLQAIPGSCLDNDVRRQDGEPPA